MIIAHAPLASSLKSVAEHPYPECARRLEAFDVPPDMPVEEVEARARAMLERVREPEALIFTDVIGATPCNVAQRLADGEEVRVIAGVNVPMLWRSLCYQGDTLEALVARALASVTTDIRQVGSSRPQNQTAKRTDDQAKHHDQQ